MSRWVINLRRHGFRVGLNANLMASAKETSKHEARSNSLYEHVGEVVELPEREEEGNGNHGNAAPHHFVPIQKSDSGHKARFRRDNTGRL